MNSTSRSCSVSSQSTQLIRPSDGNSIRSVPLSSSDCIPLPHSPAVSAENNCIFSMSGTAAVSHSGAASSSSGRGSSCTTNSGSVGGRGVSGGSGVPNGLSAASLVELTSVRGVDSCTVNTGRRTSTGGAIFLGALSPSRVFGGRSSGSTIPEMSPALGAHRSMNEGSEVARSGPDSVVSTNTGTLTNSQLIGNGRLLRDTELGVGDGHCAPAAVSVPSLPTTSGVSLGGLSSSRWVPFVCL